MLPSSDASLPAVGASAAISEYSAEERQLLLQLARSSILCALQDREPPPFAASPHLSEPRGAFTTLYARGRLRGCVGYPTPVLPLYRTVIETARAAALEDPRFRPVTPEEAGDLRISISVLSPLAPIRADEVEVGRHGLVVSDGIRRGLLLPQVPVEHGWDRMTFLEQTCRKAGLHDDAWRNRDITIEAFTAEVFGD